MNTKYREVEHLVHKYDTRNPYELLDAIGAVTRLTYDFDEDSLKGFATIMNGISYCVVNGNLPEHDRRIIAGHEAAHLILHRDDIMQSPAYIMQDFNLYDNSGKLEFEANSFLADFLVSDEQVMEAAAEPERDYFSIAKELYLPPQLLAFKLSSMIQRGYNLRNPALLQSRFLGKDGIWTL